MDEAVVARAISLADDECTAFLQFRAMPSSAEERSPTSDDTLVLDVTKLFDTSNLLWPFAARLRRASLYGTSEYFAKFLESFNPASLNWRNASEAAVFDPVDWGETVDPTKEVLPQSPADCMHAVTTLMAQQTELLVTRTSVDSFCTGGTYNASVCADSALDAVTAAARLLTSLTKATGACQNSNVSGCVRANAAVLGSFASAVRSAGKTYQCSSGRKASTREASVACSADIATFVSHLQTGLSFLETMRSECPEGSIQNTFLHLRSGASDVLSQFASRGSSNQGVSLQKRVAAVTAWIGSSVKSLGFSAPSMLEGDAHTLPKEVLVYGDSLARAASSAVHAANAVLLTK